MMSDQRRFPFNLLVILGPTASGKTRLGVQLAGKLEGEIISADSRQIYCGMDMGTGKDLQEYGDIPYHLIDIVAPGHEFSVFEFQQRFYDAFSQVREKGRLSILVGGTGLYLEAILKGYHLPEVHHNQALRDDLSGLDMEELSARLQHFNPRLHNTTDLTDRDRLIRALEIACASGPVHDHQTPELHPLVFGIRIERTRLRQRITSRLRERLDHGMIEEVARLHASGVSHETLDFYGLEYRFISRFLRNDLNRNDLFQKLNSAIHDFAKRQETWFRRMERNGTEIHWVDGERDPCGEVLGILDRMQKTSDSHG